MLGSIYDTSCYFVFLQNWLIAKLFATDRPYPSEQWRIVYICNYLLKPTHFVTFKYKR